MPLDFAPDADRFAPGVLTDIADWVPTNRDAYAVANPPFLEGYSTPVANADVIGSAVVKPTSGTPILFAGTTSKLLRANGTTGWTDRSAYTYSAADTWSFAQWSDITFAANGINTIQGATYPNAFADIAATAPTAKIVVVHENALVAFNTVGVPDGWYRSDTGDPTNWTPAAANDVDSGVLRGGVGGPIVGATVFGPLLIAWKRSGMYSGLYTGGAGGTADPKIRWDFVPGGMGVGLIAQHAFAETDIGLIFVSQRDIMVFDGGRPRSIANKLRNWFFGRFATTSTQWSNVFMTHNEVERNVYIWNNGNGAASASFCQKALVYNYQTGKWGYLSTISNGTDGTNDYVRCGVRNANVVDWLSIGGMDTVTKDCNPVWVSPHAGTGGRLANFRKSSGTTYLNGPTVTTGLIGKPDRDTSWNRVLQVGGNIAAPKVSSVVGSVYDDMLTSSPITNGGVDALGQPNLNTTGRYIQAALTWTVPTVSTKPELNDLVFQSGDTSGRR
jgi:hypothetical protein